MFRKFIFPLFFLSLLLAPAAAPAALCQMGDDVQVLLGGRWFPATVIAVNNSGTPCRIHYKGYGENLDEWVGSNRIRAGSPNTLQMGYPGHPHFTVGQAVKVQQRGNWYNAHILEIKQNQYLIKYDDYGSEWNEWVPVGRVRGR